VAQFPKYIAALLLALWLPVTMHCELERLPGFGFLQCCCGEVDGQMQTVDCEEDFCEAVESGFYKIEDNPALAPELATLLLPAPLDWMAQALSAPAPHIQVPSAAPPELPRVWQFSFRTALPPRAPSPIA
jgi:hypothetical protein